MNDVTRGLSAIEPGDAHAAEQLLPLVYDELRKLAAAKLAQERPGQTLQATALVHEAYVRLVGEGDGPRWDDRRHFFAAAAEAMRRILVENARRKQSVKHGGGWQRCDVEAEDLAAPEPEIDLPALDAALTPARRTGPDQGPARRAPLLRRPDGRPGGGGPGDLPQQRRSAVGLRPRLAAPRAGLRRGGLSAIPGPHRRSSQPIGCRRTSGGAAGSDRASSSRRYVCSPSREIFHFFLVLTAHFSHRGAEATTACLRGGS